jgi:carboxylate-amine ligase
MRTLGIEEELLVVDAETGCPRSVAEQVLRRTEQPADASSPAGEPGGNLSVELQQQQVETDTPPRTSLAELEKDLRAWRSAADAGAQAVGARIVASGTSPVRVSPEATQQPRYERIVEQFGLTGEEQLTCGLHVHVAVDSDEEGVAVLDRVRPWLPVLIALSANSPMWQGVDSGYASFRSQVWGRWPSAGPTDPFGSVEGYRSTVDALVRTGVLLDEAMVYFDARLSAEYPTVEIRVADVCLDVRDSVLVAALCRGLVDTAAGEWAAGRPAPVAPTPLLRLATWRAGHDGMDGALVDPVTGLPRPAADVVAALHDHVRPALEEAGDLADVETRLAELRERGTGARRQRAAFERAGRPADVVTALVGGTCC